MVVSDNGELNITGDMEASGGLRLNNNRQKLRQRFDIIRKLGQGTYGKVQLALNKDTGEEVAIKTIKKAKIETEQDLVRIQREIQIMSSVQHPHIIHIYEVFENKEKIVLVMEYASGGELYDYLSYKKTLGECDARRLFRQIVSAVYYCHKNKICHRDLKLENILLDEKGNTKIADFGLSNVFDEVRMLSTFCGSPLYASPEIVKGTPYYGPEVDCWSLGVLLYTLVYGAMPFDGSNFRRLVKQISEGDYYEPKQPSEASSLIRRMLTVVPSKRAAIEEVCTDWWVNLGYQDSLLTVAEEMCQAMPVRLDYLLQLVPPVPPSIANEEIATEIEKSKEQCQKESFSKEKEDTVIKDITMVSDEAIKLMEAEDDASNLARKHKLTNSAKSLTSDSTERLGTFKKKQKRIDKEEIDATKSFEKHTKIPITEKSLENIDKESLKTVTKVGLLEEILEPSKIGNDTKEDKSQVDTEPSNRKPTLNIGEEKLKENLATVKNGVKDLLIGCDDNSSQKIEKVEPETLEKQSNPPKVDKNAKKPQTKSTQKSTDGLKEKVDKPTVVTKETEGGKPAEVKNESGNNKIENTIENSKSEDIEDKKKQAKLKLSIKVNSSAKPENEIPSTPNSTLNRRGSKTIEEKKLVFPALKVSEARKAFENKPAEKRSLVIPGLKVSAARKAFEAPSANANSAAATTTTTKTLPIKNNIGKPKDSNSSGTAVASMSNEAIPKGNNESEKNNFKPLSDEKDEKDIETIVKAKDNISKESVHPEIKTDNQTKSDGTKDSSPVHHQQKVTGFVPTLDVSVDVKPSKRTVGKPPAAPRSSADAGGTSSGENTPDANKVATSPLVKGTLRKSSLVKTISNSKEGSGLLASPTTLPDNEDDKKKLQGSSSKDICGSESSFLARAFMNKTSENPLPSPSANEESKNTSTSDSKIEVNEITSSSPQIQKISSVEIQLSPVEKSNDTDDLSKPVTIPEPQPTLVRSATPGKLTLLGVKSEVCFNVDAPSEEPEPAKVALPASSQTHQSLYMNVTLPAPPPASPSPETDVSAEKLKNNDIESPGKESQPANQSTAQPKVNHKERIIPVKVEEGINDRLQQGYSFYRSKYCSGYNNRLRETERPRAPSLERSESLSSTGSIDDLEDSFFDNVPGDSMLSGILARTRSILEELTRGDSSSRRYGSLFSRTGSSATSVSSRNDTFRDSYPKRDWFSDITSGFGSRLSRDSMSDTYSSQSKNSKPWRTGSSRTSAQDADAYFSDSGLRSRKNTSKLASFNNDDDYMSDSSSRSASLRRSLYSSSYSRSVSRSISEEESYSTSTSRSGSYSSSTNKNASTCENSSRCYGRSSKDSSTNSRSSSQNRASWSNRATPTGSFDSSSSTSTVASASQDKDCYSSKGGSSCYRYDVTGNEDHIPRRKSLHNKEELRSRSHSCYESAMDEITSLYGTIRRPKSLLRYTKSLSKDEKSNRRGSSFDDFEDDETSSLKRMHRPRSILVLADPDLDAKEEDDSSVSSDPPCDRLRYSRDDVSRGGGGSRSTRNSRRDSDRRNSNSSSSKSNFTSNYDSSKNYGYSVKDRDIGSSDYSTARAYKKKLIPTTEFEKKPTTYSVSALTTELQENNRSPSTESRYVDSLSKELDRNLESERKNTEFPQVLNLSEAKTGAASYWAKRYGTNSRVTASGHLHNSNDLHVNEGQDSLKFNEGWMDNISSRKDSKSTLKSHNQESPEEILIGYARSVTTELDQLQDNLCNRYGSKSRSYRSPVSSEESISHRPERRYSISGSEVHSKSFPYPISTSEGNHPSDVVPEIPFLTNLSYKNSSHNKDNNGNTYNTHTESIQSNGSSSKEDFQESSGSTPTPTPTPVPMFNPSSVTNDIKSEKVYQNGYASIFSEDETSTPTEADDSCSVCSDSNEATGARRSPCVEEESVSERIRRKSYFARFHDSRSSRKHHHQPHRKALDVNRNHHIVRLDDFNLLQPDSFSRSLHSQESPHIITARRNSLSHVNVEDDDGNYPTLTRRNARRSVSSPPKNSKFHPEEKQENIVEINDFSAQPLCENTSLDETESPPSCINNLPKNETTCAAANGYCDTSPSALSPTSKMFSSPVSPRLTRHLSLIDDNVELPLIHRPVTSYSFDRRKPSPNPLDACSQSRAKIRSRHDYIINRALSSIDEGMGITRPYSPTSRLSLMDNHVSDLRRFSAVLDNSSPRDILRKALDVCNSLQY